MPAKAAPAPPPPNLASTEPAAPATPPKPPAPRLDRDYVGLPQPSADKEKEYLQKQRQEAQKLSRGDSLQPAQEQFLVDYYRNYALARWTFPDRQNEVAGYMNELKNDLLRSYKPGRSNPVHDKLVEEVLRFMTICTDPRTYANLDLPPTTRLNAILMIGELNEIEAGPGAKPPKPLAKALPILLNRATDAQQIDAVRVGALIGIRRHCRLLDPAAPVPNEVVQALVSLLRAKESERVRSKEGHAWMRQLAVQTFADLRGRPNTPAVAKELVGIIAETDSPEFLRFTAAEALGNLDYGNVAGLDINSMLQALGLLSIEVCDKERQRLRDELASKKAPMPSMYGGGSPEEYAGGGDAMASPPTDMGMDPYGYGAMSAGPTNTKEDRQIERSRRRLKEGMTAALSGMGKKRKTLARDEQASGLSAMAGTDAVKKQNIEAFSAPIHDFFGVIDAKDDKDKPIQAKALDTAIEDVRKKLEDALAQVGGTAPPSPEFKPLPTAAPAGGMYGNEMGMPPAP
ncbi:MAG: hypothetical protein ACYC6Y_23700 [Thermoguttaceae bacterium]